MPGVCNVRAHGHKCNAFADLAPSWAHKQSAGLDQTVGARLWVAGQTLLRPGFGTSEDGEPAGPERNQSRRWRTRKRP